MASSRCRCRRVRRRSIPPHRPPSCPRPSRRHRPPSCPRACRRLCRPLHLPACRRLLRPLGPLPLRRSHRRPAPHQLQHCCSSASDAPTPRPARRTSTWRAGQLGRSVAAITNSAAAADRPHALSLCWPAWHQWHAVRPADSEDLLDRPAHPDRCLGHDHRTRYGRCHLSQPCPYRPGRARAQSSVELHAQQARPYHGPVAVCRGIQRYEEVSRRGGVRCHGQVQVGGGDFNPLCVQGIPLEE